MSRTGGEMNPRMGKRLPLAHQETHRGSSALGLVAAVALMVGWLGGCAATKPARYYQLTVPADAGAVERADAAPVSLLIGALLTSHLYREDRIVYGNGAEQLGTYEYQRWAEPPAEMIQDVL